MPESLVLLHGFSGTRRAWDRRRGAARARTLPAAGARPAGPRRARPSARPITFDACVAHVLARRPERFALCGYSLGGRVALHVALAAPERVARLVLVSTHAGHRGRGRARRAPRAPTTRWPTSSNAIPFEEFIERWRAQPLFADDPPEVRRAAREDQRRNRPRALAAVAARHRHGGDGAAVGPPAAS